MEMELMQYKQTKTIKKVVFAVVGSGWRAGFYVRIAKMLPAQFEVCGLVTRSEEKGAEIEKKFGIKTYRTINALLSETTPDFAVVSISRQVAPAIIKELTEKNVPVLAETPAGSDIDTLDALNKLVKLGAKIQVAEQYHLQPLHKARIEIAHSGKIGEVKHVQISVANDHHGMSLLRRALGINFENAEITAIEFTSQIIAGPGRKGLPESEKNVDERQVVAYMKFGDKLGIYDFAKDQHRSWARSERFLIRGNRGEIKDLGVKYLEDFITPIEFELKRLNAGEDVNLEGYHLKGILAGEKWIYRNPYVPARLSDEEIAIAQCIEKMGEYTKGGPEFYSLAEASQDVYLSLMIEKAVSTKETVVTETQSWSI